MISKSLLDKIRKTRWARELAADYKEQVYSDTTKLPMPSVKTFTDAFENEYGYSFIVVNRSILCEKNGKDVPVKPFNPNRVVFLPNSDKDGSLVHGTLAEMTRPAKNVEYNTIDEFKLISRFSVTDPTFSEVTKGQAMVLPVIEDVDAIYVLDFTGQVELDESDKSDDAQLDEKITISGQAYKKEAVIEALKSLGVDAKPNYKDSTIIRKINELSDEDTSNLMEIIKEDIA